MSQHVSQADGTGRIDVNGHVSPVAYHLIAEHRENAPETAVRIELSLPRDWLLEKGFRSEATLIRDNGERVKVHSEEEVSPQAPISVMLRTSEAPCPDAEFGRRYPEFPR
ncbi:MAG: hypothetical protein QHC90_03135 [Shinella sp.]|nr:hypothetical protein [Shinella sp.]